MRSKTWSRNKLAMFQKLPNDSELISSEFGLATKEVSFNLDAFPAVTSDSGRTRLSKTHDNLIFFAVSVDVFVCLMVYVIGRLSPK